MYFRAPVYRRVNLMQLVGFFAGCDPNHTPPELPSAHTFPGKVQIRATRVLLLESSADKAYFGAVFAHLPRLQHAHGDLIAWVGNQLSLPSLTRVDVRYFCELARPKYSQPTSSGLRWARYSSTGQRAAQLSLPRLREVGGSIELTGTFIQGFVDWGLMY